MRTRHVALCTRFIRIRSSYHVREAEIGYIRDDNDRNELENGARTMQKWVETRIEYLFWPSATKLEVV